MKIKILLIMIIISSVLFTGCTTTKYVKGMPVLFEFEDKNNTIDNYKECFRLSTEWCESRSNCVSISIDENPFWKSSGNEDSGKR